VNPSDLVFLGQMLLRLARGRGIHVLLERRVTRLLNADLSATVRAHVSLADAPRAIAEYQQTMTGGKLLIKPNG